MKTKPPTSKAEYPDAHGLTMQEARWHLEKHYGYKTSDWPTVTPVKDPKICTNMHEQFHYCWNCEIRESLYVPGQNLECHHLIGKHCRSDEYTNIVMLCRVCHENVKTKELSMERLLWLKWRWDRQHTSWVRLCLLARRFLEVAE